MKKLIYTTYFLTLGACLTAPVCYAENSATSPSLDSQKTIKQSNVLRSQDKGWFMYNEVPQPEDSNKPEPKTSSKDSKPKFTSEWFKENLPKYQLKAQDNPTDENIMKYELLKNIMIERSVRYARRTVEVMQKYPQLDGETYNPTSSTGRETSRREQTKMINKVFDKLHDRMGLWFFFDGSDLSKSQVKILSFLKRAYDIEVFPISVDGSKLPEDIFGKTNFNTNHAEKLGIKKFPAIVLVDAKNKQFFPISLNFITLDSLISKIMFVAKQQGLVTELDWEMVLSGGRVSPYTKLLYEMQDNKELNGSVDNLLSRFKEIAGVEQ